MLDREELKRMLQLKIDADGFRPSLFIFILLVESAILVEKNNKPIKEKI